MYSHYCRVLPFPRLPSNCFCPCPRKPHSLIIQKFQCQMTTLHRSWWARNLQTQTWLAYCWLPLIQSACELPFASLHPFQSTAITRTFWTFSYQTKKGSREIAETLQTTACVDENRKTEQAEHAQPCTAWNGFPTASPVQIAAPILSVALVLGQRAGIDLYNNNIYTVISLFTHCECTMKWQL